MSLTPYERARAEELAGQQAAANAAMNGLIRGRAAAEGGTAAVQGEALAARLGHGHTPLAAALHELEAAQASGDAPRIDHAGHVLDRELDRARASVITIDGNSGQAPPRVPDFDAGARPGPVQQQSVAGSANDFLRASAMGCHPDQLPTHMRSH